MKNIYLATCIRLFPHLGGSSISTVIVLYEFPDPFLFVKITMYFFHGLFITMVTCIGMMSVLGSNKKNILLLLLNK